MTARTRLILSSIMVGSLAACATQSERVRVDQVEGGLPNCRTFAWHTVSGDAASFSDQRVRTAVMEQLKAKGYQEAAENPDCRVAYRLTTREIPKAKPGVGVGVGGGSGGIGGGIGVSLPIGQKSGFTGTFALDVIDAAKSAQVWSGTLEAELAAAEVTEEEARDLASEVLSAYPNLK
ncbi:MAG TPA: DUF4136 domain-containing protein [Steroidobacteraceae bacterium]|nr:DUF4136 domain-containing protein [Steroidobacteraceae bacterium]